ncbi:MAG: aquaporin, partial [Acidimicrobiales bacterium]
IHAFGPVSGAHLNPVVSVIDHVFGGINRVTLLVYVPAQVMGAIGGAIVANLMFDLKAIEWSEKARSGDGVWLGEIVATFGLIVVIFAMVRTGRNIWIPLAVASYIASAYYFTSSTSFANPAVTIGRTFSDTFAGIAPGDMPAFVVFEFMGGALGAVAVWALYPRAEALGQVPGER